MTKFSFCAALAAIVLGACFIGPVVAQNGNATPYTPRPTAGYRQPAASASQARIAIIDIGHIFQNATRYKDAQQKLADEMKAFDDWLKGQKQLLENIQTRMKQYNPGSAQYKEQEKLYVKTQSNIKIEFELKKRELRQKDAKLFYDAYREVRQVVQQVAKQNGILMVFRYSRDKIDQKRPDQLPMGMDDRVVYFDPNLDLTDMVLSQIERRTGPGAGTARTHTMPGPPASGTQRY